MENRIPVCHNLSGGFKIVKCGQNGCPSNKSVLVSAFNAGLRTTSSQQSSSSALMKILRRVTR
jgi:hypothetical protein